jgi:WD40 repeat protein
MHVSSELSLDIWYYIFSLLEKRDLKNIIQVNKYLHRLDNGFFMDIYREASRASFYQSYAANFFSHSMVKKSGSRLLELFDSNLVIAIDNRMVLIDRKENKPLQKIIAHEKSIFAMIQLDRKHICTASADNSIKVWTIPDFRLVDTFRQHNKTVSSLLMHGKSLLSASWDNTIIEWDLFNKKSIHTYNKHTDWVRTLISLTPELFASGSNDGQIIIWNRGALPPVRILSRKSSIFCLAKVDADSFFSGSGDGFIDLWDWKADFPLQISKKIHHSPIKQILLPDKQHIVALSQDEAVFLLELKDNELIVQEKTTKSAIKSMEILDNGMITSLTV